MRIVHGLSLLLLAGAAVAAPQKTEKFTVSMPPPAPAGERVLAPQNVVVKVSASGAVLDLRYVSETPDPIRALVERAVRTWRFAPHLDQGQPVEWVSGLSIGLNAVPLNDQGQFGLKVTRARVENGLVPKLTPPRYPPDMQRKHRAALVCVDVRLNAEGQMEVVDLPFVNGEPPRKGDAFADAVREAAKTWTATPVEFDGKRYGSDEISRIPVTFLPDESKANIPSECPPLPTAPAALRLLDDPVGKML